MKPDGLDLQARRRGLLDQDHARQVDRDRAEAARELEHLVDEEPPWAPPAGGYRSLPVK